MFSELLLCVWHLSRLCEHKMSKIGYMVPTVRIGGVQERSVELCIFHLLRDPRSLPWGDNWAEI